MFDSARLCGVRRTRKDVVDNACVFEVCMYLYCCKPIQYRLRKIGETDLY
jgi:hypothetical protein